METREFTSNPPLPLQTILNNLNDELFPFDRFHNIVLYDCIILLSQTPSFTPDMENIITTLLYINFFKIIRLYEKLF